MIKIVNVSKQIRMQSVTFISIHSVQSGMCDLIVFIFGVENTFSSVVKVKHWMSHGITAVEFWEEDKTKNILLHICAPVEKPVGKSRFYLHPTPVVDQLVWICNCATTLP